MIVDEPGRASQCCMQCDYPNIITSCRKDNMAAKSLSSML
ncbi:hypothetical protein GYH30_026727 [Glycine max]|nr:hypothetical protein GYH30_026727 [Glycine max]